MTEQQPPANPAATDHSQRDRILGPKSWTAIVALTFVLGIALWVVVSVLTAKPSVDSTVRDQMLALASSQQPDPDEPSRHPELIEALMAFDRLIERIAQDNPQAVDDHWSGTRIAWSVILEDLGTQEDDVEPAAVRRALVILEDSAAFDEIVNLLRSSNLASNYPAGLDENGDLLPLYEWLLPNLSSWDHYTNAVAARSRVSTERGDPESAARHLALASRLPTMLTRHATAVEHMTGLAVVETVGREIEFICAHAEITPQTLIALDTVLADLADLGDPRVALDGERLTTRDFLYRSHTASGRYIPSVGNQILSFSWPREPIEIGDRLRDASGYLTPSRGENIAFADTLYLKYEAATREPDPAARERLYRSVFDSITSASDRYDFLSQIFPDLEGFVESYWETRARITALEILLAMAEHRLDSGDWPTTLDQLVPDYLDAIPTNPVTGDPFEYDHEPGQPPSLERMGIED